MTLPVGQIACVAAAIPAVLNATGLLDPPPHTLPHHTPHRRRSRPKPKQLSTREMIHRDRNMQRLGLHCVEQLPKPGGRWLSRSAARVHVPAVESGGRPAYAYYRPCAVHLSISALNSVPLPHSPAVLVEIVQDACALLECRQPLELCEAIRPVQELAALVPRMVSPG